MTRTLLALLAFYRRWLSPAVHSLGAGGCRYLPTCSEYAVVAISTHGPLRGSVLALWRLLRCHPFARGGLDLVPASQRIKDRFSGTATATTPNTTHGGPFPREPLP